MRFPKAAGVAALCAATLMASAGPAAASIVTAALLGSFDDDTLPRGHWSAAITYDTSLLTFDEGPFAGGPPGGLQDVYSWNVTSGSPSPILFGMANVVQPFPSVVGTGPAIDVTWDLTAATSFDITIDRDDYSISMIGPGWSFNVGEWTSLGLFPGGVLPGVDDPFSSRWTFNYGQMDPPGGIYVHTAATDSMRVTVPEPSMWALMVVGFLGLGAALRRTAVQSWCGGREARPSRAVEVGPQSHPRFGPAALGSTRAARRAPELRTAEGEERRPGGRAAVKVADD